MWKSGIFLRAATEIHPQSNVEGFAVFHRHCGEDFQKTLSTEIFSTFHNRCGKLFCSKIISMFFSCSGKKRTKRSRLSGAFYKAAPLRTPS